MRNMQSWADSRSRLSVIELGGFNSRHTLLGVGTRLIL